MRQLLGCFMVSQVENPLVHFYSRALPSVAQVALYCSRPKICICLGTILLVRTTDRLLLFFSVISKQMQNHRVSTSEDLDQEASKDNEKGNWRNLLERRGGYRRKRASKLRERKRRSHKSTAFQSSLLLHSPHFLITFHPLPTIQFVYPLHYPVASTNTHSPDFIIKNGYRELRIPGWNQSVAGLDHQWVLFPICHPRVLTRVPRHLLLEQGDLPSWIDLERIRRPR